MGDVEDPREGILVKEGKEGARERNALDIM